jgi:hypothetical protein
MEVYSKANPGLSKERQQKILDQIDSVLERDGRLYIL